MKNMIVAGACVPAVLMATAAQAEVVQSSENGFVTRDVAFVEADLKATWLALISPAQWWSSQHTWSADAANLRLTPQAGGCFCEKIPEVSEPDRFTLEGSVEHMRVIQAYPESALRMVGALGPLQSEPVTGVLTIALSTVDFEGGTATRIVWEYNVGGPMRYEIPVISKAVDGVMSLQLEGLAQKLGKIDTGQANASDGAGNAAGDEDGSASSDSDAERPAVIKTEDLLEEGPSKGESVPGDSVMRKGPSVDEAFEDLAEPDQ